MKPKTKTWKLVATGAVAGVAALLLWPKRATAKPPPKVVTGSITFTASGSVTELIPNFLTGVEYKKTWTKAEWDKRTVALNAGDPYMDDSWKRQSQMTDDDWARYEARANTTVA